MFFEKRERKSWFFRAPHETVWERWRLRLKPRSPPSEAERPSALFYLERQLRSLLLYIAAVGLEGCERIPGLSAAGRPYPYRIVVGGGGGAAETLVGSLKRMLTDTGNAPPILG